MAKYKIEDPAVQLLAKIVHGADVKQDLFGRPEAPGLEAIAEGFRYLGLKDDHEILEKEFIVYDTLYAYCRQKVQEENHEIKVEDLKAQNLICLAACLLLLVTGPGWPWPRRARAQFRPGHGHV